MPSDEQTATGEGVDAHTNSIILRHPSGQRHSRSTTSHPEPPLRLPRPTARPAARRHHTSSCPARKTGTHQDLDAPPTTRCDAAASPSSLRDHPHHGAAATGRIRRSPTSLLRAAGLCSSCRIHGSWGGLDPRPPHDHRAEEPANHPTLLRQPDSAPGPDAPQPPCIQGTAGETAVAPRPDPDPGRGKTELAALRAARSSPSLGRRGRRRPQRPPVPGPPPRPPNAGDTTSVPPAELDGHQRDEQQQRTSPTTLGSRGRRHRGGCRRQRREESRGG